MTSYVQNDAVKYDGASYISLASGNISHTPELSPTFWSLNRVASRLALFPMNRSVPLDPIALRSPLNLHSQIFRPQSLPPTATTISGVKS